MKKELFKKFTVRWDENLDDGEKDVVIYDENNEAKFFCHYNNKPMKLG